MSEKIIIFDLDHTLGFFEQLIHMMNHCRHTCHELLCMFPEMFRPLLLDFFKTLVLYKKTGKIKSVILYSNNNNGLFVNMIMDYIHDFLEYTLFDYVITLEHPLRKSKQKDYHELLLMTRDTIHESSMLCFIDDKIHPLMNIKNVCYIKCEGYNHVVKHSVVIGRLQKEIPIYPIKKRSLNINNQCHISRLLIQRIRVFIMR